MHREDVYAAISSEREYQDKMVASDDRPDMVPELGVAGTLLAMEENLRRARQAWYSGSGSHREAMLFVRKICALGVQLGEKLGMEPR